MPLPLAVSTLFDNARQEVINAQVISGIIGMLLGPGCLVLSFLPVDALPENRTAFLVGGLMMTLLLVGLVFETRRRLANVDRIIRAFQESPESIARIITLKEKNRVSATSKIRIELTDSTSEILPVPAQDYNALMSYFRTKYPEALKEINPKVV